MLWNPVVHPTLGDSKSVPRTRFKHAGCHDARRQKVYILGGRSANVPLKDFWALDLASGTWTSLGGGGSPVSVQEHSMLCYDDCLYVFGGVFALADECPLWIYRIATNTWSQWECARGVAAPQSRKAHTAIIHDGRMFVYGGYRDMRGSLGELWQFTLGSGQWQMIHGNESKRSSEIVPPARHRHTAVAFDGGMWVYGGMTDLQERSDLWRLDFKSKRWSAVKCKNGPGPLHSHSAVCVHSQMLLIGGETQGNLSNDVWRFHFGTETWEKVEIGGARPSARSQLAVIALSTPWFAAEPVKCNTDSIEGGAGREEDDAFGCSQQLPSAGRTAKNNLLRSRLTSLGRGGGYRQVHDATSADEASRPSAWLTKSSTYSLLSNLSNDSCLDEEDDRAPNEQRHHRHHVRSESVQNFGTTPSALPCLIPRSLTAARFNPFDPCGNGDGTMSVGSAVKRDDTFITATSDYASEMDDAPFVGISNPVYIGFAQFNEENDENRHRHFALALNASLATRTADKKAALSQLMRLTESSLEGEALVVRESTNRGKSASTGEMWSIVTFGGREAPGATAPFDRPLSVWTLQI